MKKYVVITVSLLLATLLAGYVWFEFFMDQDNTKVPTTAIESVTLPVLPAKVDPKAYNGTLFTASEKLGSEFNIDAYMKGLNRNGVSWTAIYFGIEGNIGDESVGFMKKVLDRYPGRISALYSTGVGGQDEGNIAGEKLTGKYSKAFEKIEAEVGRAAVAGIGEVELTAWPVLANDTKVKDLVTFATNNNLVVMVHPKRGQLAEFGLLVAAYPQTKFLMHHFRNDFVLERQQIIELMKKNDNLFYTIDADHLMFSQDDKIGLLYKYQNEDETEAVAGFIKDFDSMFDSFVSQSIEDYSPLVTAFPDRVMVGTEMSTKYSYHESVYDRSIKILRYFIGSLPVENQESIAYKNAKQQLPLSDL